MAFGKDHHLVLVDGSGYIFRAFYQAERSLPERYRYRSDGVPVGAVHFFCNMLISDVVENRLNATHTAVVFDHSAKTFRNDLYPEYKAHRPPPPEDLVPQFASTRQATRAFNLPCLELEGYEADDIIATLARRARETGGEVTIISSDKDLMQLVGDGVVMYDTMKNLRIGPEQVFEKFGVYPDKVVEVQALMGDSADNVPGAPSIGAKTAPAMINEFGSLDKLLENAEKVKHASRRRSLIENVELILVSRKLVTLFDDVPIEAPLDSLELKPPDPDEVFDFLLAQEFRTLVRRAASLLKVELPELPPRTSSSNPPNPESGQGLPDTPRFDHDKYECVFDKEALDIWLGRISERGYVAIDTETTSLDEMTAELVGISLSVEPGKACYIPLAHLTGGDLLSAERRDERQLDLEFVLEELRPMIEDPSILKIGQNMKFDAKIFHRYGIKPAAVDDTMLLSYALHSGLHSLGMDMLSERYLDHRPIPIKDLIGSGKKTKSFAQTDIKQATKYAAEDADITLRLWSSFRPQLPSQRVTKVYESIDRPLIPVLVEMERTGIKVDARQLRQLSARFEAELAELEKQIHGEAGESFKIGSPKQLGDILFEKLRLPNVHGRTQRGWKTGAAILEQLASEGHHLPELVLEWRHLSKLKSTYTDSLQKCINPDTGRVHTSYRITGANTGRLASTDPNLQNIPVRTEEGRRIREAFVAEDGYALVSLDYSQIELRILAHTANIGALKEAFREGMDIHAMTASEVFDVPIENMDPMVRRKAKAINFGVIYGISAFGLSRDLKIPRQEAGEFIRRYFERFPGIRKYMDDTVSYAKEHKFVKTLFGRRIHTPSIDTSGPRGQFAKRAAINAPIQGSAADVIRRAMARIPPAIEGLPAKMLLQVHDELVFEVREDAIEDLTKVAGKVMAKADHPAVFIEPRLVVDSGFGRNWAEAH